MGPNDNFNTGQATGQIASAMSPEDTAKNFRIALKDLASHVWDFQRALKREPKMPGREELDSEMIANAMLAYRHIEDASMRLGKVIQAAGDGTSVYDTTPQGSQE